MKRGTVFLVSLTVLATLLLAACGGDKFEIEGKWKSVGSYGFGQAQPGSIISFDGTHCNLFSPMDTYALTKNGDAYTLDVTSLLGDTLSFSVEVVNKDNVRLTLGGNTTELQRAS